MGPASQLGLLLCQYAVLYVPGRVTLFVSSTLERLVFATDESIRGAASLQFSSTALVGANLVQFGQAAFAGGFAPQFGGSSLLWLMSPTTGMMYMSTSIVAGLEAMALQAVIAGQVPSISQAVAALSAALNPPPPHPMRLYAATQDGSKVGWMGCLAATGGACQQIYVGNPGVSVIVPQRQVTRIAYPSIHRTPA